MASKVAKDSTPTSVTGRCNNAGFSLLEVLVVVFIVGVLATMFTLSVGVTGGDRQVETEADRIVALIGLAREEAIVQGREIGLRFFKDGYEFAAFYEDFVEYHDEEETDQSDWGPLDETTLLGPRELPDGLLIELEIEGRDVVLKHAADAPPMVTREPDKEAPQQGYQPQVMVYSSGDMSPFAVRIRREFANSGRRVAFDVDGSSEFGDERQ
jgi:general secretion pathway protein H